MADPSHYQLQQRTSPHHLSGGSLALALAGGGGFGGPLLAMSGISFLASVTLFVIISPIILIFSPILFGATLFFVGVVAAFGVAATMFVAGLCFIARMFRPALVLKREEHAAGTDRDVEIITGE